MRIVSLQDLREIATVYDDSIIAEMAIPSYLHWNPLIRWLMWKRLAVVQGLCTGLRIDTVVDFGTGIGVMLPFLTGISDRVIAIDKHIEPATELCKRYELHGVELVEVDTLPLPLPDHSVDLILCLDVLEHIDDLQEITQELTRILKPGGMIVVSGPSENLIYRLGRLIAGFQNRATYHRRNVTDVNRFLAAHLTLEQRKVLFQPIRLFEISVFRKEE